MYRLCYLFIVTDIQCTFGGGGLPVSGLSPSRIGDSNPGVKDSITALLRKPEGFRGAPLFADDRAVDARSDPVCQIRQDGSDPQGLLYRLKITDFSRCGVLKRNVCFTYQNIKYQIVDYKILN